ncbi:hypothetical protein LTR53_014320 [Teratosphaeriaceae sp. CCFEE 6253]|nr:hypothetical protein LTR53_014320 [Teratosphaeriaceae sp. CCFEE 6253]
MLATTLCWALLALSSSAAVARIPSEHAAAGCHAVTIPVPVSATNVRFTLPTVDDSLEAVQWAIEDSRRTNVNRTSGTIAINQTFSIATQLCVPAHGAKKDHLQILTHGHFANHKYWDVRVQPEEYSQVESLLAAGYSVLNYDRLTVGDSERPDAYAVAQTQVEVEILRHLVLMARDGRLLHLAPAPAPTTQFNKIIVVGHSYGSKLTLALLAQYSALVDAAIINGQLPPVTGDAEPVGASLIFGPRFAAEADPIRWRGYGSGYIAMADLHTLQMTFFARRDAGYPSGFDDALLAYAWDEVSTPLAAGEWLSRGLVRSLPGPAFGGPVLFFNGERDVAACLADCRGLFNATAAAGVFPDAEAVDWYLQPGAGHGLPFHRNASAGYQVMSEWLGSHGL